MTLHVNVFHNSNLLSVYSSLYTVCCNEKRLAGLFDTLQTLTGFCVVERLFNECEKLHFSYVLTSFVGEKKPYLLVK